MSLSWSYLGNRGNTIVLKSSLSDDPGEAVISFYDSYDAMVKLDLEPHLMYASKEDDSITVSVDASKLIKLRFLDDAL